MVLPADEPDDEQRQEELENDFQPPFSFPEDEDVSIADEDEVDARRPALGTTHPITDSNIDETELYQEGPSGAAGASEPNADDSVLGYQKPETDNEDSGAV